MKLSKIYTNLPQYFKPIHFNEGLNVIIGKITKPKDKDTDSHNLGKSLLIDVIDYCLLKQIRENHFTKKLPENLQYLEFYLEIILNKNNFLTIRRNLETNTKICFKESKNDHQDFTKIQNSEWTHFELPLKKAKKFLDGKLNLTDISPFSYRKGVSYYLRTQQDYLNVFQIDKFKQGQHSEWKPYIGKILGFSDQNIKDKYDLDQKIEQEDRHLTSLKATLDDPNESIDKLRARIEAESQRINTLESKIDAFDFKERDLSISTEEIQSIESKISYINNEIYNLNSDLTEISKSLDRHIMFKIEDVKQIFKEIKLSFKESVVRKYKELENFNRQLTRDRKKRLQEEKIRIEKELSKREEELSQFNKKRMSKLAIIREKDTFKKYKKMQSELVNVKSNFEKLNRDLKTYEKIIQKSETLDTYKQKREEKRSLIKDEVGKKNDTLIKIREFFRELTLVILKKVAILYVTINKEGNIEFSAEYTKDKQSASPTAEGEGTSYKKLLCNFFDLAVLRFYKDKKFYHFTYHDGILEGLDDRKKLALINVLRKYTKEYNIQYILTVIESDLPRIENNERFHFSEKEVIRKLTDEGDSGRLFNCPIF